MAREVKKLRRSAKIILPRWDYPGDDEAFKNDRNAFRWEPRWYQWAAWDAIVQRDMRRACLVWHRRAGKDLLLMNIFAKKSQERVGLYWHCFPEFGQGRKTIWEGTTYDGKRFLSAFPEEIVESYHDHEMRVKFRNGSIYQIVGMEDPDKLVGPNPIGLGISEFMVANPKAWQYWQPILAENDGWAVFIFTPRGMENHGYKLFEMAQQNPKWFCQLLNRDDTWRIVKDPLTGEEKRVPVLTDEAIEEMRRSGMDEPMIRQEAYCDWNAPLQGCYYTEQMDALESSGKISRECVYDPNLPVITAWDLGRDGTAIWFIQQHEPNSVHVIDYYEKVNTDFSNFVHYVKTLPYVYDYHIAPWDIKHKDSESNTRLNTARKLGVVFRVLEKDYIDDGITAVRALLQRCYFNLDKTRQGVKCLRQYRREWDDNKKCYRDEPIHDWASHGADSFRTLAMGLKRRSDPNVVRQETYNDEPCFI